MKKTIFLIFLIIATSGFSQEVKPVLKTYGLKGKVKSITTLTYEPVEKFGRVDKGDIIYAPAFSEDFNNKREFNEIGYLVRYVLFNLDGTVADRAVYDYDEKDHLVEQKTYQGDGTPSVRRTYTYAAQGELSQSTSEIFSQSFRNQTFYSYSGEGILNKIEIINPDGTEDYFKFYKYKGGNLIEEEIKTTQGKFHALERFTYSGNNLTEQVKMDELGNTLESYSFKYNKSNNVIEEIKYNSTGDLLYKEKKDYNLQGDITLLELESMTIRYEYNYDKFGNWITKLRFKNGFPTHYFEREIVYY